MGESGVGLLVKKQQDRDRFTVSALTRVCLVAHNTCTHTSTWTERTYACAQPRGPSAPRHSHTLRSIIVAIKSPPDVYWPRGQELQGDATVIPLHGRETAAELVCRVSGERQTRVGSEDAKDGRQQCRPPKVLAS